MNNWVPINKFKMDLWVEIDISKILHVISRKRQYFLSFLWLSDPTVKFQVLCGTLLSTITAFITMGYMSGVAKLIFTLDEFPDWAVPVDANTTLNN